MTYVNLADVASNRFKKRVGFSFGYLVLGPIYALARLRYEGLIFLLIYYYMLPIPGLSELGELLSNKFNNAFIDGLNSVLLFFRSGWDSFAPYLGIILVIILHVWISTWFDNYLLKKKIIKKKYYPISENDARILLYYKVVKPDVLLADEYYKKEHFQQEAAEIWEKKNLDFTTMFSNKDLKKNSKTANRKKLMRTNTQDITRPYKSKTITNEQAVISSQHEENLRLLKSGLISKEEFEILEDRLYKNK